VCISLKLLPGSTALLLLSKIGLRRWCVHLFFFASQKGTSVHLFFIFIPNISFLIHFVAGVAGGAASGKTTVCDMIIQQLHDQRVVLVNQVMFSDSNTFRWLNREVYSKIKCISGLQY
jgi:hypothetical protein